MSPKPSIKLTDLKVRNVLNLLLKYDDGEMWTAATWGPRMGVYNYSGFLAKIFAGIFAGQDSRVPHIAALNRSIHG